MKIIAYLAISLVAAFYAYLTYVFGCGFVEGIKESWTEHRATSSPTFHSNTL